MRKGAGAIAALAAALVAGAVAARMPLVTLPDGTVSGIARAGAIDYRRIPFAAPPVGAFRWRPPQPVEKWSGVRDGSHFAPGCPQIDGLGVFAAPSETEDCLYLNVTVPAGPAVARRPVLFWIPGGAFFAGSAADYDPAAFARRGVVVVTANYRVGLLGFFAHPAIDGEGHAFGNYGLMDQQAALRWVRANIARLGGDPANVTIAGQSAGGSSVIANLVSPGSQGLYARAISMSGGRMIVTPIDAARRSGQAFAAAAGCSRDDAACLRALPVKTILARQRGLMPGVILDGTTVTEHPGAAIAAGHSARVPLITGFTSQEQAFGLAAREMTQGPLTAEDYPKDIPIYLGRAHADRILAAYPLSDYPSPSLAEIAAVQGARACTSRWLAAASARWAPTFAYEFDDATAPSYFPKASFPMGAYHTAELQYLFPLFKGGLGTAHPLHAAQKRLADTMLTYWVNFIRTGNPNERSIAPWRAYDPAVDSMIALGSGQTLEHYGDRNRCDFWDKGGFGLY